MTGPPLPRVIFCKGPSDFRLAATLTRFPGMAGKNARRRVTRGLLCNTCCFESYKQKRSHQQVAVSGPWLFFTSAKTKKQGLHSHLCRRPNGTTKATYVEVKAPASNLVTQCCLLMILDNGHFRSCETICSGTFWLLILQCRMAANEVASVAKGRAALSTSTRAFYCAMALAA